MTGKKNVFSEIRPQARLIEDEKPPIGQDIWLFTRYGTGYRGRWQPGIDDTIVAWCPLPKLTAKQKHRLQQQNIKL